MGDTDTNDRQSEIGSCWRDYLMRTDMQWRREWLGIGKMGGASMDRDSCGVGWFAICMIGMYTTLFGGTLIVDAIAGR